MGRGTKKVEHQWAFRSDTDSECFGRSYFGSECYTGSRPEAWSFFLQQAMTT